jgi:hypothetical protein
MRLARPVGIMDKGCVKDMALLKVKPLDCPCPENLIVVEHHSHPVN